MATDLGAEFQALWRLLRDDDSREGLSLAAPTGGRLAQEPGACQQAWKVLLEEEVQFRAVMVAFGKQETEK